MTRVKLASVRTFPSARPDKEHALKPLEEAAEVFGAWQLMRDTTDAGLNPKYEMADLMDEIADAIQACCNLAAVLGVTDLTPYLARCEERNRKRGAMTSRCCADCIHLAPWPERMRFARELMETMPEDYPLWACMRHMANVRAVSPHDGTACTYFERGDRDEYIKEV